MTHYLLLYLMISNCFDQVFHLEIWGEKNETPIEHRFIIRRFFVKFTGLIKRYVQCCIVLTVRTLRTVYSILTSYHVHI